MSRVPLAGFGLILAVATGCFPFQAARHGDLEPARRVQLRTVRTFLLHSAQVEGAAPAAACRVANVVGLLDRASADTIWLRRVDVATAPARSPSCTVGGPGFVALRETPGLVPEVRRFSTQRAAITLAVLPSIAMIVIGVVGLPQPTVF